VNAVPTIYRPRPTPCLHCGDVVLIGETSGLRLFGMELGRQPRIGLQHADPGPDGEVFDPVDDGCRRPPVTKR